MKITRIESLHADAGWRNFDFLKISTDEGITGWSEYNENFGGPGLSRVIDELGAAPRRQGPARVGSARGADVRAAPPGDAAA